jgi:hypothetical protein
MADYSSIFDAAANYGSGTTLPTFSAQVSQTQPDDYNFFQATNQTLQKYVPILSDLFGAGVNVYQSVSGQTFPYFQGPQTTTPTAPVTTPAPVAAKTDYTPFIVLGIGALALFVLNRNTPETATRRK